MPPPSLFTQTIVSGMPARRALSRPPTSWSSATSPVRTNPGRPEPSAAPAADETTPSIPFAPRAARKRSGLSEEGKKASTSRIGIEWATQTRASPGSAGSSAAGTAPRSPRAPPRARRERARRLSARSRPGRIGGRLIRGQGVEERRRVAHGDQARLARGLVPSQPRVHHRLVGTGKPRAERLGHGRLPDPQHALGTVLLGERPGAQENVVVGDHVRAVVRPAADARGRVCQQRPAEGGGQPRGRLRHGHGRLAAHDHPARRAAQPLAQLLSIGGAGGPVTRVSTAARRRGPANRTPRAPRARGRAARAAGS